MYKRLSHLFLLALLAALPLLSACQTRTDYPEPAAGWHSESYDVLFGRLVRVPGADLDDPPTWAVRFGGRQAQYGGELALLPGEMMKGFSGGEPVEIRGHTVSETGGTTTNAAQRKVHYAVKSIRMWAGYRE